MKLTKTLATLGLVAGFGAAATVNAAHIVKSSDIAVSETWTADNTYQLDGLVHVLPGATLTIEPGVKVTSNNDAPNPDSTLIITRGAKIYIQGTKANPVVFTSTSDNGTQRVANNEWGNITLEGRALIGAYRQADDSDVVSTQDGAAATPYVNTAQPTGLNRAVMEGLVAGFTGDPKVLYGGDNDDDDTGCISYLSLRYGGRQESLNKELNGLSMGAVGRETDVHHVDIWGNVDDGIETWGGTVNYRYINIWNIGDDSFDVDQGWRGKAQFGLIVQGYSADAKQGSGVGDNCIEIDGAEAPDAQPCTTAAIYNFTAIGQPGLGANNGGDYGTAWRDNAHVQYRNCLWMDTGDALVKVESSESTTGHWVYGFGGTIGWPAVWSTSYTELHNTANALAGGHANCSNYLEAGVGVPMSQADLEAVYRSQSAGDAAIGQGMLCEITNSVFYNIGSLAGAAAYAEADTVGVTVAGGSNPAKANVVAGSSPISTLTRGAAVVATGKVMQPVTSLDPRPGVGSPCLLSDAFTVDAGEDFIVPVAYRGAFSAKNNWCLGWTAADEYGLFVGPANEEASADMFLAASTCFQTTAGCTYVIECWDESGDCPGWKKLGVVQGDGTLKYFADFDNKPLAASKIYRVYLQ